LLTQWRPWGEAAGRLALEYSPLVALGIGWLWVSALLSLPGQVLGKTLLSLWVERMHHRWPWLRWGQVSDGDLLLGAFTLLPLAITVGLWAYGLLDLGASMPALMLSVVWLVIRWQDAVANPATVRLAQQCALALAGLYTLALSQPDLLRQWGVIWPVPLDPTSRRAGWTQAGREVRALWISHQPALVPPRPNTPMLPMICSTPELAAVLDLQCRALEATAPLSFQPIQSPLWAHDFALWTRWDQTPQTADGRMTSPYLGQSALYLFEGPPTQRLPDAVRRWFTSAQPVASFDVMRSGYRLRRLSAQLLSGFRVPEETPPLPAPAPSVP
jgi:hypothetical protein